MQLTYESMMAFAENWIAAWNRRDIEAVLAHFAEDARFSSPIAQKMTGRAVLRGKQEIRNYWQSGLERLSTLQFRLDHAAWDASKRELNVVYEANLNGDRKRACEIMRFDALGKQIHGEALYGAPIGSSDR